MTIRSDLAAPAGFPVNSVENALYGAVRDRTRVGELLDELCHGRLWLPLPDDRPVTDGHALTLPTVRYLDAEFVPAFTSAGQLREVIGRTGPDIGRGSPVRQSLASAVRGGEVPHAVVPAVQLARLLPAGLGIALNPGAAVSVPIYPDDVAFLASTHAVIGGSKIRVGPPPEQPSRLLSTVAASLRTVPATKSATSAWLTTEEGHGLVICVTLDDPQDGSAQEAVADVVQHAVDITGPRFAVDIMFPGEFEPGPLEQWTAANAEPFYLRA